MLNYWLAGLVRLGEMTIYPIGALFRLCGKPRASVRRRRR